MLRNKQFLGTLARSYHKQFVPFGLPIARYNFSLTNESKIQPEVITQQPTQESLLNSTTNIFTDKKQESELLSHLYVDDTDSGAVLECLKPINDENTTDMFQFIYSLNPATIFQNMEQAARDLLLYLGTDLGWGMGVGIIVISAGIKLLFTPAAFGMTFHAQKMKLIEPEMKNFQAAMQRLNAGGNFAGSKQLSREFQELREKHGLISIMPVVSLLQLPVLISWFFALRDISTLPDKYPGMKTDGFLWFQDLSSPDPYYILPILSALMSYYNISFSPRVSGGSFAPQLAKYARYIKYVPFFAIPITGFFPASLNMYWAISAALQLFVTIGARNPAVKQLFGVPEYLPGTILEGMNQKQKPQIIKTKIVDSITRKPAEGETATTHASKQTTAEKTIVHDPSKGASHDEVKVFTTKPKKTKKP